MQPILEGGIPSYYFMWGIAAVACLLFGFDRSRRDGEALKRMALGALLFVLIVLGSKALYAIEALAFPADDYVPAELRGALHGFRIPGGIIVAGLSLPWMSRSFGRDAPHFGDNVVTVVAIMLVFVRLGCFLNGCCFGRPYSGVFAVTFPPSSWAYFYHAEHQWIEPGAARSLPVHPLQIYFVLSAVAILVGLLLMEAFGAPRGVRQHSFFVTFFGSMALLEALRQNYLTINNWILWPAAMVSGFFLVRSLRSPRHERRATPSRARYGDVRSYEAVAGREQSRKA
jgi:phosphatidylglycerol:prolipoprotein diacylglycerol transferase